MTLRLTISAESVRDAMPPDRVLLDAAARGMVVAASDTFRCPTALGTNETIQRGTNACPSGWTVINTD